MYLLLASAYLHIAFIPPLIPFSIINNILILVSNSNLTSFKQVCHVNVGADLKNKQDQAYIFQ